MEQARQRKVGTRPFPKVRQAIKCVRFPLPAHRMIDFRFDSLRPEYTRKRGFVTLGPNVPCCTRDRRLLLAEPSFRQPGGFPTNSTWSRRAESISFSSSSLRPAPIISSRKFVAIM